MTPPRDQARRGLVAALVAGLLGGALALLVAGRRWAAATVTAPTGTRLHVAASGRALAPALPALGVAALALTLAVLAARGPLRRLVGLLLVVVGGATVAVSVAARGAADRVLAERAFGTAVTVVHAPVAGWWLLAVASGLLMTGAGALTVTLGRHWPSMGSRYDAPRSRRTAADPDASAWDALDRGDDPTV
jgi:uncharacterized membrane protein (TIGR02234 family)